MEIFWSETWHKFFFYLGGYFALYNDSCGNHSPYHAISYSLKQNVSKRKAKYSCANGKNVHTYITIKDTEVYDYLIYIYVYLIRHNTKLLYKYLKLRRRQTIRVGCECLIFPCVNLYVFPSFPNCASKYFEIHFLNLEIYFLNWKIIIQ